MVETKLSACPLDCPDACTLEVTVDEGRVTAIGGDRRNPLTAGFLCSKVRHFDQHVYHPLRLNAPMIRLSASRKGVPDFRATTWDEALGLVAERMREVERRSGGEAILPFAYGGSNGSVTDGALDEVLWRRLGASRLRKTVCAAATGAAAGGLYGTMPGVAFADYVHAELIVVWGANPHASNIHLTPYLKRAKDAGARIVVVDPRRTKVAKLADLHLPVFPGADLPLALSVIRWLFESGAADTRFLDRYTTGARRLRERAQRWTFARAADVARVDAADLERFARLYAASDPAVIRCGWGLERNRNGGSAVAAVLALPAVAGKFGRRGGGYTLSNARSFHLETPFDDAADEEAPTRAINMNRLGRTLLSADPPVRLLFVYNANPLATIPYQRLVRRGLERDDLFTVVFDQVLTDTARYADVLLPATTFLEHTELRRSYGAFALTYAEPAIEPVGEARPNYQVFAELLRRLGLWRAGDVEDPRELARRCLAEGEDPSGTLEKEGVLAPAFGVDPVQLVDVHPRTPDGRIHLFPTALDVMAPNGLYVYRPDPAVDTTPLALISPATEKRISSTLGQLHPERVAITVHPDDAAARGLSSGDRVRAFNAYGEVVTTLALDPDLRPGVACLPKGLWSRNTENGLTANALAPDTATDLGEGACFNDARVELEAAGRA